MGILRHQVSQGCGVLQSSFVYLGLPCSGRLWWSGGVFLVTPRWWDAGLYDRYNWCVALVRFFTDSIGTYVLRPNSGVLSAICELARPGSLLLILDACVAVVAGLPIRVPPPGSNSADAQCIPDASPGVLVTFMWG